MTLGKCDEVSFDEAKTKAFIAHGEIAKGNDPRTGSRISTKYDITLQEACDKFLETKPLREATQQSYLSAMKLFDDWLDETYTK